MEKLENCWDGSISFLAEKFYNENPLEIGPIVPVINGLPGRVVGLLPPHDKSSSMCLPKVRPSIEMSLMLEFQLCLDIHQPIIFRNPLTTTWATGF